MVEKYLLKRVSRMEAVSGVKIQGLSLEVVW